MRIHMDLDFHEPPDGDFVRLVETLVGSPPEDPETTAKQITAQLVARSQNNLNMVQSADTTETSSRTAGARGVSGGALPVNAVTGGPPDIADALESMARSGASTVRRGLGGLSRLMIYGGVAVIAAAIVLADMFPGLSPAPGIGLVFAGIVLRNMAS